MGANLQGGESGSERSGSGAEPVKAVDDSLRPVAADCVMKLRVFGSAHELAVEAAKNTAKILCAAVRNDGTARLIMATGNSQLEFVEALWSHPEVPWARITLFHMDEYVGMPATHPASFARWLQEKVSDQLKPGTVHYLRGDAPDVLAECQRYEALLLTSPINLTCMGIGENGHIAFNEPGVADFKDECWVRLTSLDGISRMQQVGEGHFAVVADVPERVITVTVPALLSGAELQIVVPGARKADAVWKTLHAQISPDCPASVLRLQPNATLFLDAESAGVS